MLIDCRIFSLVEPDIQWTSFKTKQNAARMNKKKKSEECQMNMDIDKQFQNIFCCYCQIRGLFSVGKKKTKIGKVDWRQ